MFCPQYIYVFCVDLRTNRSYFSFQHYRILFYNRGRECLLRGTDWVFKSDSYSFVLKRLIKLNISSSFFSVVILPLNTDKCLADLVLWSIFVLHTYHMLSTIIVWIVWARQILNFLWIYLFIFCCIRAIQKG